MRTCPHCGRFVTDASALVCPSCGASLSAVEAPEPQPTPVADAVVASAPVVSAYVAPPAPPYGPAYGPTYSPTYGPDPTQLPASSPPQPPYGAPYIATAPGANWRPAMQPERRSWARLALGIVGALVVIAIAAALYNQSRNRHLTTTDLAASATAQADASSVMLSDPLTTNTHGWANDSNHCYFDQDGYHNGGGYICYAPIGVQTDGTESVTASQIAGPDTYGYGMVFRMVDTRNFYQFVVDSNSKWAFFKVVNGVSTRLQDFTVNAAINGGLNTANTLVVTMTGSTFDCYVNGEKMTTIHDSTFGEGKWGLSASPGINVLFTDYIAHQ